MKTFIISLTALTAAASLNAQIVVTHTASGQADLFGSDETTFALDYALQGGSSNSVLAVGFFWDNSNLTLDVTDLSAITFGGEPADVIENRGVMAVAYWLNPTGSDFSGTVTRGVAGNEAWIIHELGNVDTSIAPVINNVANPVGASWTLTTATANSLILNWIALRDDNFIVATQNPFHSGTLTKVAEVLVERTGVDAIPGELIGNITSGTAEASTIGSYDIGWTPGGNSDVGIALAFAAIAEPFSGFATSSGQADLFNTTQTTFTLDYALQGGSSNSVLAVGFFWDNSNLTSNVTDLSAITFGGVAADAIENRGVMAVAYWFNPTGSDFSGTVTRGVGGREAWIIHELGNVDTSIAPVISNTANPAGADTNNPAVSNWTLTTATANSRILNWIALRDDSFSVATQDPFHSGTLTKVAEVLVERIGASALPGQLIGNITSGTAEALTIGSYDIGWTPGGNSDVGIALAFTAITEPSSGFAEFMAGFESLSAADREATADPDGDGIPNLLEYALAGLDPTVPDVEVLPALQDKTISYTKRALAVTNDDVTYRIESSTNLLEEGSWGEVTPTEDTSTTISYTLPEGLPRYFVRLRVLQK